ALGSLPLNGQFMHLGRFLPPICRFTHREKRSNMLFSMRGCCMYTLGRCLPCTPLVDASPANSTKLPPALLRKPSLYSFCAHNAPHDLHDWANPPDVILSTSSSCSQWSVTSPHTHSVC